MFRNPFTPSFENNIWKIYAYKLLTGMHFTAGVLIPFFIDYGGLNMTQTLFLQSWFLFWIFALEIPTGAIADRFGRKYSLVLGCALVSMTVFLYGTIEPGFYNFLIPEFLWGAAVALFSGADRAMTYDTLKKLGKSKRSKEVFGRAESFGLGGIIIGAPIGSMVAAQFGLAMPMIMSAAPFAAAALVTLSMKEPISRGINESARYLKILIEGVKFFYKKRELKILALDMIWIFTLSYFVIWLYQPMLIKAGVDIAYFGIISAFLVLAQILILNSFGALERLLGSKKRLIILSSLLLGAMYITGGLTSWTPLLIVGIVVGGGFGLAMGPLFASYMNKYIPSPKRATVISSASMLGSFVLVVLNPLVGYFVDWSLNYTLIILGIASMVLVFISRTRERHLKD